MSQKQQLREETSEAPKHSTEPTIVIDFIALACLLVFSIFWAVNQFITSPPYVDPVKYPIRGIDVSAHNGMMNLDAAAKDGVKFIFIKASEGATFRDENFRLNYQKARDADIKIGAYHFFRFDVDGISQALNLLEAVGDRHLDLGLVIDVEKSGNPGNVPQQLIQERLSSMVDFLSLKGYRVMFYTNRKGYYDYIKDNFEGFPLWICSFNSTPIYAGWTFWQFNHRGRVKGIRGDIDINTFCGSKSEWTDFLVGEYHPEGA